MSKKDKGRCSFCGNELPYEQLFQGVDGRFICFECIESAHAILAEQFPEALKGNNPQESKQRKEKNRAEAAEAGIVNDGKLDMQTLPRPTQIKAFLDQYVIGQDEAKKHLAVAVYNHYKRLLQPETADGVEIEKSNIILVGSTGTGKTLMARTIAKMLAVPFTIVDATVLTEAGYVGEDVESLLVRLLQEADYDLAKTERGIVFIDDEQNLHTIWEFEVDDPDYQTVIDALDRYVKGRVITDVYLNKFRFVGTQSNIEIRDGSTIRWEHFYLPLPDDMIYRGRDTIDTERGQQRDTARVFERSLSEISLEAIDTVLDLISTNTLYRGTEWKNPITELRAHKVKYDSLDNEKKIGDKS